MFQSDLLNFNSHYDHSFGIKIPNTNAFLCHDSLKKIIKIKIIYRHLESF